MKSLGPNGTAAKSDAKADAKSSKDSKDSKADVKNEPEDQEALEAEIERIEKENQRKQDDYNDKVKKGQDRAKELNARFADWYYVVDDETYKKIHLGQAEIIKKKSAQGFQRRQRRTPPAGVKNPFRFPRCPGCSRARSNSNCRGGQCQLSSSVN